MARPEMERRAGDRNPGAPNSCRMEVLRQDAWPCHRHRTIATQTSTVLPPLTQVPTQDAFSSDSVPQQDNPLRDNTGKVLQHRDSCLCNVKKFQKDGDEMNAVFLQRNAVPGWQNWRGLYHGLFAFVADTINALYQHGLR
uniref:Uncharacterized LOC107743728 n=1 Tax=Sinocyclocheilus rhinocerous TaxID=307959 RepID=A0A673L1B5_9TELE